MITNRADRHMSGLLFVLVAAIVAFGAWAHNAELTQHVKGQGRIVPSGKLRQIQHFEGGIVRAILVQEGDQVEEGDVLFEIDNVAALADLNEARIRRDQLAIKLERLTAEQENYRAPDFPEDLVARHPDIVRSETALFEARKEEFYKNINVLQDQIEQKQLKLNSLDSTRKNLLEEISISRQKLALTEKLVRAGSASQREILDARSRVQDFQTRISRIEKDIPVLRAEKKEAENKLARLSRKRESDIIEELSQVAFESKQVAERLQSYDDVVSRTKITAPVRGVLNARYVDTLGGVVRPGGIVADIMPLEEQLVIEGQVPAEDRTKIYVGLPVKIRLSAYDFRKTNAVDGTLDHISADSFISEDGRVYYRIRVSIRQDSIPSGMDIFSGMVVDLLVSADRITVLAALLRPFLQVMENAFRDV